ncbi:hypothetical protein J7T55_006647 [Diaporthe amygdali]|uniref:uncharacterized protein n=1 Tax=Phomopsis amygdali TaxID=1214568 RepID=UPI0022FEEE88|nr:uncharacterized protein J7T55_006647 [Diaporthe amygdali]KAJ0125302.1 hypothetical protein J7T55_006647 [Diaporthe amygdali]
MDNPRGFRCRRGSSLTEPEVKESVDEYMSPDILHVFREDRAETPATPLTGKTSSDSVASGSLLSFPQFQRLPVELRYLIWEAAVPEPTVVPRTWNNSKFRYNLQRNVPAVLQACTESRGLLVAQPGTAETVTAAPKYELVQTRGREDEGVYMDFEKDSIWIYRGYDINEAEVASYANLRSLVMNWGLRPCWVDSAVDDGVRFIRKFPKLRLLTLLVDFKEHGWPDPSTLKGLRRLKRTEFKRIWALVRAAFRRAELDDPSWTAPSLHIVHRTENWCRQEAR